MKHFQKIRRLTAALLMVVLLITSMPVALAASFSAYVKSSSMAVYADKALSEKLGTLPKYTVVTVKSHSGGVAKISYMGKTGYAKNSAMESVEAVAEPATVKETTKVYKEASTSSDSAKLAKGTKVNVIAVNGSWALIEKDGVGGYTKEKYLSYASTAKPTATPKPTERPEPITEAIINANTKVYKKASTSSASVSVKAGTVVSVLSMDDGWAYIRSSDGVNAYIKTKYLSEPDEYNPIATATPAPTATAKPTEQPTEAPTEKPTEAPTAKPEAIGKAVINENTKVYKKASTSSTAVSVKKGTVVEVLKVEGDWVYIRSSSGVYAYIKKKYLTDGSAATPTPAATAVPTATATAAPTATPTAKPTATPAPEALYEAIVNANTKVYKKATTSSASASVSKGTMVDVLQLGEKWSYIRSKTGVYAYIKTKYLTQKVEATATPAPTATAEPTATPKPTATPEAMYEATINANTKVYQKASSSSASASVKKGTVVDVLQTSGDWAYVRSKSGVYAYIKTKYLTKKTEAAPAPEGEMGISAVVNADTKVYKKASSSSSSTSIKKGTAVVVLKLSGDWAYIRKDSSYGYIKNKYLDSTEAHHDDIYLLEETFAAVVAVSEISVFSEPHGTFWGGVKLGSMKKGVEVTVFASIVDGSWVKVSNGKLVGWVEAEKLSLPSDAEPDPLEGFTKETFGATVVTKSAEFFDIEGDGSGKSIAFGTDVTVNAYNDEWAYVQHGSKNGFIAVSALSRKTYAELKKGDSDSDVSTLEKALLAGGYFDAVPDKNYDAQTVLAVKRYQAAVGRSETGTADQTLQRMLYSGNGPKSPMLGDTLSKGDDGDNVTRLQTRLYALGYLSKTSSIDGSYGVTTAAAVALFQNSSGMTATSKADAQTLAKLYATDAKTLPSGKSPADVSGNNVSDGGQVNNATFISSTLASTVSEYSSGMSNSKKLEYAIYVGQNQLGKPYVYGANGPSSYDCTGFTCYCFKQIGITLKRTAVNQGYDETYPKIENISDLKRGDLVFFDTVSDSDLSDHSGIYLGNGWFIHSSSGQGKVVVSNLASGYYNRVFSWGRRVF